jgi:hypothetical protein
MRAISGGYGNRRKLAVPTVVKALRGKVQRFCRD